MGMNWLLFATMVSNGKQSDSPAGCRKEKFWCTSKTLMTFKCFMFTRGSSGSAICSVAQDDDSRSNCQRFYSNCGFCSHVQKPIDPKPQQLKINLSSLHPSVRLVYFKETLRFSVVSLGLRLVIVRFVSIFFIKNLTTRSLKFQ